MRQITTLRIWPLFVAYFTAKHMMFPFIGEMR